MFKVMAGPIADIQAATITRAQALRLPIDQVAARIGFSDAASFSAIFQKMDWKLAKLVSKRYRRAKVLLDADSKRMPIWSIGQRPSANNSSHQ